MQMTETPRLRNLRRFFEDYLELTHPGSRLVSFDFFLTGKTPDRLVLVLDMGQKQALMDSSGKLLGCFEEILPLCRLHTDRSTAILVEDLQEQLMGLRSKVAAEEFRSVYRSVDMLCCRFRSVSAAYLVKEQGLYGVVDTTGRVIIPIRYRHIAPFPFREAVDSDAQTVYGETGLYLCSGDLHRLNSMDVYDQKGNLIFGQVGGVYPREEIVKTPAPVTEVCVPAVPALKQLRSLWVCRQVAEAPFPDAPQLQNVVDENRAYTLRELYRPVREGDLRIGSVDRGPHPSVDFRHARTAAILAADSGALSALLLPMAATLDEKDTEQLLQRLGDYENFRRERQAAKPPLTGVTANTELSRLGLTARTYNCLVRNGIRTAGEIAGLSDERLAHFRRSQPQTLQEITVLREQLRKCQ